MHYDLVYGMTIQTLWILMKFRDLNSIHSALKAAALTNSEKARFNSWKFLIMMNIKGVIHAIWFRYHCSLGDDLQVLCVVLFKGWWGRDVRVIRHSAWRVVELLFTLQQATDVIILDVICTKKYLSIAKYTRIFIIHGYYWSVDLFILVYIENGCLVQCQAWLIRKWIKVERDVLFLFYFRPLDGLECGLSRVILACRIGNFTI